VLPPGERGGVDGIEESGVPRADVGRLEEVVEKEVPLPKECCDSSSGRDILSRMLEGGRTGVESLAPAWTVKERTRRLVNVRPKVKPGWDGDEGIDRIDSERGSF